MFHRITCPTCQHKFTVPEAQMGQRQTCPNCQSLFQAGKSVAETPAEVPMKLQPAAAGAAPLNKTMLGETEPPIKYNCPRCKKALESPAIEAGTKKPCPACGGRLQVPQPKPAPAAPSHMNKTMLASDESASPVQAGPPPVTIAPQPREAEKAATITAPPAKSPFGSPLVLGGIVGGGVLLLAISACVITMLVSGGGAAKQEALAKAHQEEVDKARRELENFKREIQEKQALMDQKRLMEAEYAKKWDDFLKEHRARQKETDAIREKELAEAKDQEAIKRLREKREREKEEADRVERERLAERNKKEAETQAEIARLKAQVDAATQAAQQRTVVVSQPAPVYYPPYHYRYYYGW